MKFWIIFCASAGAALIAVAVVLAIINARSNVLDGPGSVLSYTQITQEKAVEMMARDDGHIIVDVRRQDEYDEGHIPGAVCIPNEEIGAEPPAGLPDKEQIILVYCRSGRRSKEAAQKLFDMGYINVYEFGGIIDWTGEVVKEEHLDIKIVNEVEKADFWIIPDTGESRGTSLWGKATVPALGKGESGSARVHKDGETGLFLFRVIDEYKMYYEANGLVLEDGCTVRLFGGEYPMEFHLEVADPDGRIIGRYDVFAASL